MKNVTQAIQRVEGQVSEVERDLKRAQSGVSKSEDGSWEHQQATKEVNKLTHKLIDLRDELQALYEAEF